MGLGALRPVSYRVFEVRTPWSYYSTTVRRACDKNRDSHETVHPDLLVHRVIWCGGESEPAAWDSLEDR